MTELEIIEKIEKTRAEQGLSMADVAEANYHTEATYCRMVHRASHGGSIYLCTLIDFADFLGLELILRRKKAKHV